KVALAGVRTLELARRRQLEALPRAAVGLQFHFRFRCVPWHCWKSSRQIFGPLAAAIQALYTAKRVSKKNPPCPTGAQHAAPLQKHGFKLDAAKCHPSLRPDPTTAKRCLLRLLAARSRL